MHHEGQDSARQAAFGLDEAADHHNNQDDADVEGGARRQGLEQTMHGRRRKGYWVSARIGGEWVECFHNRPSIPNPSTESYSNGKTRELMTSKKPITVYLRWPEQDLLALSPLVRLLWSSLIDSLIT